jgi:hypothetical protein
MWGVLAVWHCQHLIGHGEQSSQINENVPTYSLMLLLTGGRISFYVFLESLLLSRNRKNSLSIATCTVHTPDLR